MNNNKKMKQEGKKRRKERKEGRKEEKKERKKRTCKMAEEAHSGDQLKEQQTRPRSNGVGDRHDTKHLDHLVCREFVHENDQQGK